MTNQSEGTFQNNILDINQLPSLEQLTFLSLSKTYIKVHRQLCLIEAVIVALVLFILLKQPFFAVPSHVTPIINCAIWVVSGIGLLASVYCYFADPKKGYALRELDLSYTSGLIFRKTVTQPILRIQHVELKRGPVDRKCGLAKLQIFSAGGAMHTFEIPGLELATAQDIRQFILSHKDINLHG